MSGQYSISTDSIEPKNAPSVTMVAPVMTHSLMYTPIIGSATIQNAIVYRSMLTNCTLSNMSPYITQGLYEVAAKTNCTVSVTCALETPTAFVNIAEFTGTALGAALVFSPALPLALRPTVEVFFPIHTTITGTATWGVLHVGSDGVMTMYSTLASGVFTNQAVFAVKGIQVKWNVVPYV